jgi:uncharacterized membrane protein YebE (DUF533 family)
MVDLNKLVSLITGSGVSAGLASGVAGGALVTALASRSGRKAAKSVAQIGGLAAVGALAWNAYKKYQGDLGSGSQQGTVTHGDRPQAALEPAVWQQLPQEQFSSLASNQSSSQGLLVLRTMISAAMADGHLSPQEQVRIFERLDLLGLNQEERSTLFDELRHPMSCDALAAQVSDPVLAIEVYTGAVMMLDNTCVAAEKFLGQLSAGLKLPDSLVASIHKNTAVALLANAS